MPGKYEEDDDAFIERSVDIWWPFFHRQYEGGFEGRIRREYMDLASPPFYPKVFEKVDIKPDETVLDLGCGDGTDIVNLRKNGHQGLVVGLETPVPENADATENKVELITQNVTKAGYDNFDVRIGYAEEIDFEDETFDTVLAANVLQEVSDKDRVLDHIYRVLKPGGKLIVITNHKDNKPLHHGLLDEMAKKIGGVAPQPYSSGFNSITGPLIMARHRHQFRKKHEVIQQGMNNLPLTRETLPYLTASLATYWFDIVPSKVAAGGEINREELIDFLNLMRTQKTDVLKEVEAEIRAAIDSSPHKAVYETIKRVAYLYKKRSKPAHFVLNSAATIKERPL